MDPSFIAGVCILCPHFVRVGNGIKGGYRIQKCYYQRDVSDIEERRFTKGELVAEVTECPDEKRRDKFKPGVI